MSESSPVRVLHVLATGHSHGTSAVRIVTALADGLDNARYQLDAWILGADGPLSADLRAAGVHVRCIPWKGSARDPAGAWRVWGALCRARFDLVHLHTGGGALRLLARAGNRAALVAHLHERVVESQTLVPRPLSTRGTDAVIAVSRAVAEYAEGGRVIVIHPGVRTPAVPVGRTEDHVIGTACRLVPVKGVKYLLRAVAELRREIPEVRLEVAGSGPSRAALEVESHRLGIADAVAFLGWQPRLDALWSRWSVFVLPSVDEGLGIVLLEAMAAGLPVVSSAVGGTPEVVRDGVTGLLVPARDPDAIASRLRMLISDAPRRHALGAAARRDVAARFTEGRMVREIEAVYDFALSSRSHRASWENLRLPRAVRS